MRASTLVSTLLELRQPEDADLECFALSRSAHLVGIWVLSVSKPKGASYRLPLPARTEVAEPAILIWGSETRSDELRPMRASELISALRQFMSHEGADPRCFLDDADSGRRAVTGAFVLSTDPAEGVRRRLQALGRKSLVLW